VPFYAGSSLAPLPALRPQQGLQVLKIMPNALEAFTPNAPKYEERSRHQIGSVIASRSI